MNQITVALKEAGMALPTQNQRIWNWLKDHPNKTTLEISKALNLTLGNVSSLISGMYKRKMVTAINDKSNSRRGVVGRYSVVGREYELLPLPKQQVVARPQPRPIDVAPPAPTPNNVRQAEVPTTAEQILEKLSVKQAHELYVALHGMFGGAK